MWVEALYERVLALVPPEEREVCLNKVLQKEFSVLDEAVNDILAAFTKLDELRNAISKLENNSASIGGHSASLVATMESTNVLERQLEKMIRQIAAGIATKAGTEERIRTKGFERHNRQLALTDESSDMHQLEVRQETKEESLSVIPSPITKFSAQPRHTARKKMISVKPPVYYVELVKEVDALPPQERICRIPEVLRELTISLTEDTSYGQRFRVTSYLKDMIPWVNKMVRYQFLDSFLIFVERVKCFAKQLPRSDQKRGLLRLTDNLSAVLHDKPIPFYSKPRNQKCT
ncbi:Hypothetical protein PHPALM_20123 [Phytophthora palmivora]|uniref:Uncharacterized protein n=1 Tax=Phytophthora palmivora TaxID=4796 RepID=A0A2P4XFM7_9STRA|nr:Hypothetical protein PHPALM_20123 [Phytophthora palmivora]